MIKKISLLFALVAVLPASSFAWVGGPFDGGDYNQLQDDSGVYQAAFRMRNGSGFSQFGVNVDLGPSISSSSTGGNNSLSTTIGSYLNRTVVYYKGVTYFGNATGFVDHTKKEVQGFANGNSDVSLSASSSGGDSDLSATSTITYNGGINFSINVAWKAKITSTHPELRFSGEGELSVVNPSLSQVAYAALTNLITNYTPPENTPLGIQITQLVAAIGILADSAEDVLPTTDGIYDNAETVKISVYGQRKFFLTRRG